MQLLFYQLPTGRCPLAVWLAGLKDRQARARIEARLAAVATGTLGDCEPVGGGVLELRVPWGPGYRIYFARVGHAIVLLLCGGDKRTQEEDIKRAKAYFEDYKRRARETAGGGRG